MQARRAAFRPLLPRVYFRQPQPERRRRVECARHQRRRRSVQARGCQSGPGPGGLMNPHGTTAVPEPAETRRSGPQRRPKQLSRSGAVSNRPRCSVCARSSRPGAVAPPPPPPGHPQDAAGRPAAGLGGRRARRRAGLLSWGRPRPAPRPPTEPAAVRPVTGAGRCRRLRRTRSAARSSPMLRRAGPAAIQGRPLPPAPPRARAGLSPAPSACRSTTAAPRTVQDASPGPVGRHRCQHRQGCACGDLDRQPQPQRTRVGRRDPLRAVGGSQPRHRHGGVRSPVGRGPHDSHEADLIGAEQRGLNGDRFSPGHCQDAPGQYPAPGAVEAVQSLACELSLPARDRKCGRGHADQRVMDGHRLPADPPWPGAQLRLHRIPPVGTRRGHRAGCAVAPAYGFGCCGECCTPGDRSADHPGHGPSTVPEQKALLTPPPTPAEPQK